MSRKGGYPSDRAVDRDNYNYSEERYSKSRSSGYSRDSKNNDNAVKKRKYHEEDLYDSDSSTETLTLVVKGTKMPWPSDNGELRASGNLYGLNPEFIKSLGIVPPLEKWVHVTNFRCDKSELKEVLELAGHVVMCSVIAIRERYAKVMFSHPLEAVQAISMLNGQTFYGQKLTITMIPCPTDTVILPKGLPHVGPGLGTKGKPLADIVKQYNNFIKQKESLIDTTIFSLKDDWPNYDFKKTKISKDSISLSSLSDDEQDSSRSRRKISFKVKNVDELQDINNKDDLKTNSPHLGMVKVSRKDESSKGSDVENKNLQVRHSFHIPTLGSSNQVKLVGPQSSPKPVPFPQNMKSGPEPGFTGPNIRPGPVGPPGFNMGTPVAPNMPMRPMGPPGGPMGGPGMMMNTAAPGFVPGPPGIVGPPRISGPGPMGMNMGGPGPMNAPGGFGPPGMSGPPAMPVPPGVGPTPVPVPDTFGLEFSNLPPSTTFPLLCEKVSRCGQVLSLQLTTPGCAMARFSTRAAAERCFQVFNGLCIDGCVIQMRYM